MNIKSGRILLTSLCVLALSASVSAQDLEMGYFLGGNPYAFRQNPAFQSERAIVSIGLGQTGLGTWSNLGVSTLLYPGGDGKVYTFLNDRVPASEFLGKIGRRNSVDADALLNVLTVGFWAGESDYYTIDVNVRSVNAVTAPYDFFRFLKEGSASSSFFDLSGIGFRSQTFAEAAFGWSRNFGGFSAGFRAKALLGGLGMEARMKKLQMTMDSGRWEVRAEGEMTGSSPYLTIGKDQDGYLDFESLDVKDTAFGLAGFGGAVDLGFSWEVHPLLTVSGALLDLGAIRWNHDIYGTTPNGSYVWDPSGRDPIDPTADDALDQEVEDAVNSLEGLFRFQDAGSGSPALEMLPFRLNVGAEFRMPFYERLSVGALYTGRGGHTYTRHTGRVSLNWNPLDFLGLSMGTTVNKLGQSLGFAFNLHPVGVNLTLGCDYIPFRCVSIAPLIDDLPAKYSRFAVIPEGRMNLNLYVGLNLAFGRSRLDYARRVR